MSFYLTSDITLIICWYACLGARRTSADPAAKSFVYFLTCFVYTGVPPPPHHDAITESQAG